MGNGQGRTQFFSLSPPDGKKDGVRGLFLPLYTPHSIFFSLTFDFRH
jgi:hypothetical protein